MLEQLIKEINENTSYKEYPESLFMIKNFNGKHTVVHQRDKTYIPFNMIEFKNREINLQCIDLNEDEQKELIDFLNAKWFDIAIMESLSRLNKLAIFLKEDITDKGLVLINKVKSLSDDVVKANDIVYLANLFNEIEIFHSSFDELYDLLSINSTRPVADCLESLYFVLTELMKKHIKYIDDFFDVYYEYKSAINNNKIYVFDFYINDVHHNYEINSIEELIKIYVDTLETE